MKQKLSFSLILFVSVVISFHALSDDIDSFKPISLKQTWQFCTSEQFDADKIIPESDCLPINIPSAWEEVIPEYDGLALLKTKFKVFNLPQNLSYGLYIESIRDADKVFINGKFIGEFGDFPPNFQKGVLHSRLYKIPHNLLKPNSFNEIKIWIFNDARIGGINLAAPVIGDFYQLLKHEYDTKQRLLIFIVMLIVFSIVHLFYFFLNKASIENWYYSLYLFAWAVYLFTHSLFSVEAGLSLNFIFRLNVALFFLTYSILPFYIFSFFGQELYKGIKVFTSFGLMMIPVCFLLPEPKMLYWPLELAEVTVFIPIAMLLHFLYQNIKDKRPYAKSLALVLSLYFLLAIIDIWIDFTQSSLLPKAWHFGAWPLILLSFTMSFLMAHKYRTYVKRATTDHLTSVLRRDEFIIQLNKELQRSSREKKIVATVMIDLDNFKSINDLYGHAKGDEVLSMVTRAIKTHLRLFDLIGRYGGDEFCVAASFSEEREIEPFIERLNNSINDLTFQVNGIKKPIQATSGAVINKPHEKNTAISLLEQADQLLIKAKNNSKGGIMWS